MHNNDRISNVTQSNFSYENVPISLREQTGLMAVSYGDQKQLLKLGYDYINSDSNTLNSGVFRSNHFKLLFHIKAQMLQSTVQIIEITQRSSAP